MKKPLLSASKRLQRMLLKCQAYGMMTKYFLRKSLLVAETVGTAYLPEVNTDRSVEQEIEPINMVQDLPISKNSLQSVQQSSEQGAVLQGVKQTMLKSWPDHKAQVPLELASYYQWWDELSHRIDSCSKETVVVAVARTSWLQFMLPTWE